jgi:hypothetical protein
MSKAKKFKAHFGPAKAAQIDRIMQSDGLLGMPRTVTEMLLSEEELVLEAPHRATPRGGRGIPAETALRMPMAKGQAKR